MKINELTEEKQISILTEFLYDFKNSCDVTCCFVKSSVFSPGEMPPEKICIRVCNSFPTFESSKKVFCEILKIEQERLINANFIDNDSDKTKIRNERITENLKLLKHFSAEFTQ